MKKVKKILSFDIELNIDMNFSDLLVPIDKTKKIPMKKTIVVDNKNKNKNDVGIF